jgi:hypothetical protein
MVDATGHEHLFVEKVPVVTAASLGETSNFPQPGFVACIVIGRNKHEDGRQLVQIDTQTPWGIETTVGRTKFEVFSEQLCEFLPEEWAQ